MSVLNSQSVPDLSTTWIGNLAILGALGWVKNFRPQKLCAKKALAPVLLLRRWSDEEGTFSNSGGTVLKPGLLADPWQAIGFLCPALGELW